MEIVIWSDHVRNLEVLHGVKEERNFPQTTQIKNANWIGHILRRNCLLETCYWRKGRGKYIRDGKAREKK